MSKYRSKTILMSRISLGLAAVFEFNARGGLGLLPDQHLPAGLPGCPLLLLHPLLLLPPHPQLVLCHSRFTALMLRTASTAARRGRKVQVFQVRKHRSREKRVAAMGRSRNCFSSPRKSLPAPIMPNDSRHVRPILRLCCKHPSQ